MLDSGQETKTDSGQETKTEEDKPRILNKKNRKRYGSYVQIQAEDLEISSGRTALCHEVLNNEWRVVREDDKCRFSEKTAAETAVLILEEERAEVERLWLDMEATRDHLVHLFKKLNKLPIKERLKKVLDENLDNRTGVHVTNLKTFYGNQFDTEFEKLQYTAYRTLGTVIEEFDQRITESKRAYHRRKPYWVREYERLNDLALDSRSDFFKIEDSKELQANKFIEEIKAVFKDKRTRKINSKGPHIVRKFSVEVFQDEMALIRKHVRETVPNSKIKKVEELCDFICEIFGQPLQSYSDENGNDVQMDLDNDKDLANGESPAKRRKIETEESNDNSSSKTSLDNWPFFINDDWYVFFRLFTIFCERLSILKLHHKLKEEKRVKEEEEEKAKKARKAKKDGSDNDIPKEEAVVVVVDTSAPYKKLLGELLKRKKFAIGEERSKKTFGLDGYLCLTLNQLCRKIARKLSQIALEDSCRDCVELYRAYKQHVLSRKSMSDDGTIFCCMKYEKEIRARLLKKNCYRMEWLEKKSITFEFLLSERPEIMLFRNWKKQLKFWKSRSEPFKPSETLKYQPRLIGMKVYFEKSPEEYNIFDSSSDTELDKNANKSAIVSLDSQSNMACTKQYQIVLEAVPLSSEMELDNETGDATNEKNCLTVGVAGEKQYKTNIEVAEAIVPELDCCSSRMEVDETTDQELKSSVDVTCETKCQEDVKRMEANVLEHPCSVKVDFPCSNNVVSTSVEDLKIGVDKLKLDCKTPMPNDRFHSCSIDSCKAGMCNISKEELLKVEPMHADNDCSSTINLPSECQSSFSTFDTLQKVSTLISTSATSGLDKKMCQISAADISPGKKMEGEESIIRFSQEKDAIALKILPPSMDILDWSKSAAENQLDCDCALMPVVDKTQQVAPIAEIEHYRRYACVSCDDLEDYDFASHTIAENPSYGNVLAFCRSRPPQKQQEARRQKCGELRKSKFSKWHPSWLEKHVDKDAPDWFSCPADKLENPKAISKST